MTDRPPDERPDQPTTDVPATPDSPTIIISSGPPPIAAANEPAGVGFAAIRPPGQPAPPPGPPGYPPTPPPGYVQGGPPPPPAPPGAYGPQQNWQGPPPGYPPTPPPGYVQGGPPVPPGYAQGYVPGYAPPPPASRGGPSVVLAGVLALVIVLAVGVGALFAFGLGPFAPPTPTPIARPSSAPTPVATVAPTLAPTSAPVATTAASPTVEPSATASVVPNGDATALLLTHVPAALVDSCSASPGSAPIVVLASCIADDGVIEVTYFQYDSRDSMFQAYEGFRLISEIEPGTGDCNDPTTWPAEDVYNIDEQPSGRWLCTEALGQTTIYWTDDRLNILSQATHTTADYARLVEFWVGESGPYL